MAFSKGVLKRFLNWIPYGVPNGIPNDLPNDGPNSFSNCTPNGAPNDVMNGVLNDISNGVLNGIPYGVLNDRNDAPAGVPNVCLMSSRMKSWVASRMAPKWIEDPYLQPG